MTLTHYVGVLVYRRSPVNGELEFLVIDYRSIDPRTSRQSGLQTKFPGGTNRECPDESVAATRDREVWEETGLAFLKSKEIWKKQVNPEHTKYGFLVNFDDCLGELRQMPMVDDGDELSTPYWVPAATLGRELFHSHQGMYLAACGELGIF